MAFPRGKMSLNGKSRFCHADQSGHGFEIVRRRGKCCFPVRRRLPYPTELCREELAKISKRRKGRLATTFRYRRQANPDSPVPSSSILCSNSPPRHASLQNQKEDMRHSLADQSGTTQALPCSLGGILFVRNVISFCQN